MLILLEKAMLDWTDVDYCQARTNREVRSISRPPAQAGQPSTHHDLVLCAAHVRTAQNLFFSNADGTDLIVFPCDEQAADHAATPKSDTVLQK